ncbi:MAG TPA: leucyl/phenylalanyl-tRNA--protein transferase [Verrucomicrobiae bacterium]|nr:leucyl/phenylalanyl-tRNA--protein transferase [Verrucomicrobiae bacterium]
MTARPGQPAVLNDRLWFPSARSAIAAGPYAGLVALGGDLSVDRLVLGYRNGIFPWTVAPITWWSPDPRAIFELDGFHVSRSLAAALRKRPYEVTFDRAFRRVIEACGDPGRKGAWITPEFVDAYTNLHLAGHAHSVECWQGDELVGGVYGVAVGGLFAGESMFHRADNASKIALCHLFERLRKHGFLLFDTQMVTPATAQLGAHEVSREDYLERLKVAVAAPVVF